MPVRRALLAGLLLISSTALCQTHVAALPTDPLELATGPTLLVNTPERRSLVLGLLERARQQGSELYASGAPPFRLKLSFTSSGQTQYSGSGEMDEIRFSRQLWRWSARLGDYSQLRIFQDGVGYDEKPPGPIPLRLQMVRGAVLWSMIRVRPGAKMRMATAKWEGMELMCALLSGDEVPTATPGRRWEEREYCVDPKEGLLRIYSEAPGIYVTYDYHDGPQFHERKLARDIAIVEEGNTVLQIHVESIQDPGRPDPNLFTPTKEMLARGPGLFLRAPVRIPDTAPLPGGNTGTVQPVIIHATIDNEGKVVEAEPLQSSDPSLTSAAMAAVRRSTYATEQGGRMPSQSEAFIEVEFGTR